MGIWCPYPLSKAILHKSGVLSELFLPPAVYLPLKMIEPAFIVSPQFHLYTLLAKVQHTLHILYLNGPYNGPRGCHSLCMSARRVERCTAPETYKKKLKKKTSGLKFERDSKAH